MRQRDWRCIGLDPMACQCLRVVRLELTDKEAVWICNMCNAQFVPKKAVDYKIASLAHSVMEAVEGGVLSHEQVERMWKEEGL